MIEGASGLPHPWFQRRPKRKKNSVFARFGDGKEKQKRLASAERPFSHWILITSLNHGLWPCDPKSFQRCLVYLEPEA